MKRSMTSAGWFGSRRDMLMALAAVNADRDEDGNFLAVGEPIVMGLDPDELVVPPGAMYSVDGRGYSVADLLNGTNCGKAVTIIG